MTDQAKDAWAHVFASLVFFSCCLVAVGLIIALGHAPTRAKVLVGVGIVAAIVFWFLLLSAQSMPRNNVSRETSKHRGF